MARSLWDVFRSLYRRSDGEDGEGDDSGFLPSPLDLSVRVAHGGPDQELDRELHELDERARELEDTRREG